MGCSDQVGSAPASTCGSSCSRKWVCGFLHSANFILAVFCRSWLLQQFGKTSDSEYSFCYHFFFSLSHLQPLCASPSLTSVACDVHVCLHVCGDCLAGVCRCSPHQSTLHMPVPAPETHTQLFLPIQTLSCLS